MKNPTNQEGEELKPMQGQPMKIKKMDPNNQGGEG
jgi:hypothetical protein